MPVEIRAVDALRAEIKSVDSKAELLEQKIKTIEKQNVTLANTLFKFNERIKKLEEGGVAGEGGVAHESEQSEGIATVREEFDKIKKDYDAIKSDLLQMKYTLGMINPLEFVTTHQVTEMVEEALEEKLEQMKKKQAKKDKED